MEYITCAILFFSALIAVVTDLKSGLIKNWLTVPLWLGGLTDAFVMNSISGLGSAFFAGLLFVVSTFKFSTPGGGDIKFAMGVGAWIGFAGWPIYFVGMAATRIILSLAVKLKIYSLKGFITGIKYELATGEVYALGDKNYSIFQKAAENASCQNDRPVVPGALWVTGGVLSYIIFTVLTIQ